MSMEIIFRADDRVTTIVVTPPAMSTRLAGGDRIPDYCLADPASG